MENAKGGEVLPVPEAEKNGLTFENHHLHVTRTVDIIVIKQ